MDPYFADDHVTVHYGDCLPNQLLRAQGIPDNVLASLADSSVDAVVTDPPYGISFMGKQWDQPGEFGSNSRRGGAPNKHRGTKDAALNAGLYDLSPNAMRNFQRWCETWSSECLRILKPGGHMLAFGGSRTWHRLAAGVEDAGFEIRDSIAWLSGQGFPKSVNLGGGLGTALKPAFEPCVVARKPLSGTVAATVLEHGTGALNIDACRINPGQTVPGGGGLKGGAASRHEGWQRPSHLDGQATKAHTAGRWPANVLLDESQACALDDQTGILTSGANPTHRSSDKFRNAYGDFTGQAECVAHRGADSGGASRFFPTFRYEAKAPSSERPTVDGVAHPTVKPLDLMRWLVRLVTPANGLVLDPFAGSGTTAEACVYEHMRCITIEREAEYLPLIVTRLTKPLEVGFDFGAGA